MKLVKRMWVCKKLRRKKKLQWLLLLFGLAGLLFIMINIRTEPVHAAEAEDADSSSMQLDLLSDLPLSDIQDVLKQNTEMWRKADRFLFRFCF